MKTYIKIFVGLVSIVFLSGCSVYQHVNLASNTQMNEQSEFLIENDSINIIYSFSGQGGPIYMEIFNKLDQPFCIDWRKSALIINGQSHSLWKDEARLSGTSTEYRVIPENGIVNSTSNIDGTIVKADKVTFIPPHSKIIVNSYFLHTQFFDTPEQAGEEMLFYTNEGQRHARKFSFSEVDSPLNFRIFLSFSMDESFNKPLQFDNSFWVSEYFKTSISPKSLGINPGNQFYNRKKTSFSRTMGYVSVVGIIVAGAALGDSAGN